MNSEYRNGSLFIYTVVPTFTANVNGLCDDGALVMSCPVQMLIENILMKINTKSLIVKVLIGQMTNILLVPKFTMSRPVIAKPPVGCSLNLYLEVKMTFSALLLQNVSCSLAFFEPKTVFPLRGLFEKPAMSFLMLLQGCSPYFEKQRC